MSADPVKEKFVLFIMILCYAAYIWGSHRVLDWTNHYVGSWVIWGFIWLSCLK